MRILRKWGFIETWNGVANNQDTFRLAQAAGLVF